MAYSAIPAPAGFAPPCHGRTFDTLLAQPAACGRRCDAAIPAPAGFAPPCHGRTYISFDELPDENWAIAGKLLDED